MVPPSSPHCTLLAALKVAKRSLRTSAHSIYGCAPAHSGDCWAFSAAGAISGLNAIVTKTPAQELSAQVCRIRGHLSGRPCLQACFWIRTMPCFVRPAPCRALDALLPLNTLWSCSLQALTSCTPGSTGCTTGNTCPPNTCGGSPQQGFAYVLQVWMCIPHAKSTMNPDLTRP